MPAKKRKTRRNPSLEDQLEMEPYLRFDGNMSPATWAKFRPELVRRAKKYANPYKIEAHYNSEDFAALESMRIYPSGEGAYGRAKFEFSPSELAALVKRLFRGTGALWEEKHSLGSAIAETLRLGVE